MATSTITSRTSTFRGNFYFRDGVVLTGIMVTLLYLIVATSLDAAHHVESMALLIPVTFGAAMLGLLMAYSRFDGFFALSHSMFTGLAWILFLMSRNVKATEIESFLSFGIPEMQAKVYYILYKLLTWVDAAMKNKPSNDNYVFIFEISFLLWWLTYLGIWAIFRYGYTWRSVIPAGIVLLLNTYFAPEPVLGFLVVFSLLALIFLVRTNLAEQQLRWREQRIYFNQDITLDFLRTGLMYSVIVLCLAWIAPSLGSNSQVQTLLGPVTQKWTETNVQLSQLYKGLRRQSGNGSSAFGTSLALGGERKVENTPIFTVSSIAGRYWRAVAFDAYDGRGWQNTLTEKSEFDGNGTMPAPDWQLRTLITQTISLLAPTGNVIFGSQDIRQVSIPVAALAQPMPGNAILPGEGGVAPVAQEATFIQAQNPLEVGASYTVLSQVPKVTEKAMREAGVDYPQLITAKYLQLPENFSERVAATAISVTVGAETPFAKAKAVETYLRTFPYNDTIPAPDGDKDPVEYFLYEIKEGYCDYYATAMVLMLRHLGVPSRVVSGYAEGIYDDESGLYFVTDKDAHTWVEVFFPNLGWVEFEPTAGESPLMRPADENSDLAQQYADEFISGAEGRELPNDRPEDNLPGQPLFNPPTDAGLTLENNNPWQRWLWLLLTPLLLLVGFLILRRTQFLGPTSFTPELPPILYDRLWRWAERLGLRTRTGDTPYEQARIFGRALPDGRPFIEEITENYVYYRFSGKNGASNGTVAPAPEEGEGLVLAWRKLHPMLWKAWGRNLWRTITRRSADTPFALVENGRK